MPWASGAIISRQRLQASGIGGNIGRLAVEKPGNGPNRRAELLPLALGQIRLRNQADNVG